MARTKTIRKRKVNIKGDEVAKDVENGTELNKEQDENTEDVDNATELNKDQDENDEVHENEDPEEVVSGQAAPEKEQDPVQPLPKRRRGPTRMKHIAKDPNVREPVDFPEFGEPCRPGSMKLSSYLGLSPYLGPLVREHVPIIIDDWRKVGENIKTVL